MSVSLYDSILGKRNANQTPAPDFEASLLEVFLYDVCAIYRLEREEGWWCYCSCLGPPGERDKCGLCVVYHRTNGVLGYLEEDEENVLTKKGGGVRRPITKYKTVYVEEKEGVAAA